MHIDNANFLNNSGYHSFGELANRILHEITIDKPNVILYQANINDYIKSNERVPDDGCIVNDLPGVPVGLFKTCPPSGFKQINMLHISESTVWTRDLVDGNLDSSRPEASSPSMSHARCFIRRA